MTGCGRLCEFAQLPGSCPEFMVPNAKGSYAMTPPNRHIRPEPEIHLVTVVIGGRLKTKVLSAYSETD